MPAAHTPKSSRGLHGVSSDDATKRAIEDHSQSDQYLRLSAQYIIVANAGAAGAMLTFLTAVTTTDKLRPGLHIGTTIHWLGGAASFFLFGAFICLMSVILQARAKRYWGYLWEELANFPNEQGLVLPDFGHIFAKKAERLDSLAAVTVMLSLVMFFFGSIAAIFGFMN